MATLKLIGIDDILAADDLDTSTVECPEWGGTVQVRGLSRAEVLKAIEKSKDDDGVVQGPVFQMELVLRGMGLTEDRAEQLNAKHVAPIKRIETEVRRLSGIAADARFLDDD